MERDDIVNVQESQELIDAAKNARNTFRYFWRELYWERRRIVPGLDLACVKVEFRQEDPPNAPMAEFMWISDIDFDGINVSGYLISTPSMLTNIKNGDFVQIPFDEINDWLFAISRKAYGGFTIQVMRGQMDEKDRKNHDDAWGLDFGDHNNVLVAYQQKEHPENLTEHPMCRSTDEESRKSFAEFIKQYPGEITYKDEGGYTMLHREAIAGNKLTVEILLQAGADAGAKTADGFTAADFAKKLGWEHIVSILA